MSARQLGLWAAVESPAPLVNVPAPPPLAERVHLWMPRYFFACTTAKAPVPRGAPRTFEPECVTCPRCIQWMHDMPQLANVALAEKRRRERLGA